MPRSTYSTLYVAQRLGVSVPTVQRWVDSGRLRAWKTQGGHRRIEASSADALIREHEAGLALAGGGDSETARRGLGTDAPRPLRVVVVDDQVDDRELLAAICDEALPGADITLAENGFVGLVAIGRLQPDAVITDVAMPTMDGVEMLRQLRESTVVKPRVLIAVSSLAPERLFRKAPLPAGVAFLAKPVEPAALVALLRQGLGRGDTG